MHPGLLQRLYERPRRHVLARAHLPPLLRVRPQRAAALEVQDELVALEALRPVGPPVDDVRQRDEGQRALAAGRPVKVAVVVLVEPL